MAPQGMEVEERLGLSNHARVRPEARASRRGDSWMSVSRIHVISLFQSERDVMRLPLAEPDRKLTKAPVIYGVPGTVAWHLQFASFGERKAWFVIPATFHRRHRAAPFCVGVRE
ncbi:hypothetical protein AAFF_G00191030 [Aldrovandia affinis]|uniref:Uncharacterized protein n=1 Tax=Aldrovandia affinis TaxID=143900 RepID=A0AAD7W5Q2_9TELE|nr:hypothetical protein AAFF_G00191030 [Aldrovandia affinis]